MMHFACALCYKLAGNGLSFARWVGTTLSLRSQIKPDPADLTIGIAPGLRLSLEETNS